MHAPTLTTRAQSPRGNLTAADGQPGDPRPRRRRVDLPAAVYRCVAALVALLLLTGPGGARGLLSPWAHVAGPEQAFELHRWHATDISAFVTLLLAGSLLASLHRPRQRSLLVQAFLVGCLVFAAVTPLLPDPATVLAPVAVMTLLIVASYPQRRALLRLPAGVDILGPAGFASLVATPFLVANGWQNLALQLRGVAEHAALGHWAGAAALALGLLLTTWLAATSAPGAGALRAVVAVSYLYLGVAALTLPRHDGSWSTAGGIVALAVGALLLAAVRRPAPPTEADR